MNADGRRVEQQRNNAQPPPPHPGNNQHHHHHNNNNNQNHQHRQQQQQLQDRRRRRRRALQAPSTTTAIEHSPIGDALLCTIAERLLEARSARAQRAGDAERAVQAQLDLSIASVRMREEQILLTRIKHEQSKFVLQSAREKRGLREQLLEWNARIEFEQTEIATLCNWIDVRKRELQRQERRLSMLSDTLEGMTHEEPACKRLKHYADEDDR